MINAYSRQPSKLMGGGEGAAKHAQPVSYRRARLISQPDRVYFETRVHWHTGDVVCFLDADDAMNNVPVAQFNMMKDTPELMKVAPQTCDQYVLEVFMFLRRGHSMLHPDCQCDHGLSFERALELGVGRPRQKGCLVPRDKTRKSLQDIALELNVQPDLAGLVQVTPTRRMPLLTALVQLAGMVLTPPHKLHSPLCCVPPCLTHADDIINAARIMAPLPFSVAGENALRLLRLLQHDARVFILAGGGEHHVFWNEPAAVEVADADIRDLWHTAKKEETRALEHALVEEGLRPMQMRPLPPAPPAPRAATSKKRPTTSAITRRQKNIARLISQKRD